MNLDRELHKKKSLQQFERRRSNKMRLVLLTVSFRVILFRISSEPQAALKGVRRKL